MNFKWDKKYLYWGVTAFLVIAAAIVFFLGLSQIKEILDNIFSFLVYTDPRPIRLCYSIYSLPDSDFHRKAVPAQIVLYNTGQKA